MEKHEKEKLSRYGKLVWDFANGDTTDRILTDYFKNLQSAFGFSKEFEEKALLRCPTKKMTVGSLSEKEYCLFELFSERNKIKTTCNQALVYGFHLINYNPIDKMFTIGELNYNQVGPDEFEEEDITFLISLAEIESEILRYVDDRHGEGESEDRIKARFKTMASICQQIEELNTEATPRFQEIEKMAEDYSDISKIHDHVQDTKEKIRSVLVQLTESDNAYKTQGIRGILLRYNAIQKKKYIISDNNNLVEIGPFTEDYFLDGNSKFPKYEIFNAPISYCLLEFLKNPEYSGKERIAVCRCCCSIFSKTKLNDKQIYCSDCSKKNHVPRDEQAKRTKASRDAAKKRAGKEKRSELYDSQYKRLLASGHSIKQAEQKAKEYVIEQMGVIE